MIKLEEYFTLTYGTSLAFESLELDSANGIPFISRISNNNGFINRVKRIENIQANPKNTISCVLNGYAVLECFLQKEDWYSSYHVMYLTPKIKLSEKQMLYYCMIIKANKYKYSFGRQANRTLKNILIPSIEEIPEYVEKIKIPQPPVSKPLMDKTLKLDTKNWKEFTVDELFKVSKGCEGAQTESEKGDIPFISAVLENNGVQGFIDDAVKIFDGNIITVPVMGAAIGQSFYQKNKCCVSNNVNVLVPRFKMTEYVGLFLSILLRLEKFRFNYGRILSQGRLKKISISLPATLEGSPDWQFMENYIKSLSYSSSL